MQNSNTLIILAFSILLSACAGLKQSQPVAAQDAEPISAAKNLAAGDAAYNRGELENAQIKYLVALNSEPENPVIYYRIGSIYEAQNKNDLAEESFRRALLLDEGNVDNSEALGLLLLKSGKYKEAQKLLKTVVLKDRNRWRSFNGLGVVYDMEELYEQAQSFYRMAIRINSRSAKLENNLGYSLYLNGQWDEAESHFRASVNMQPSYSQAWSNLGLYYVRVGKFEAAQEAFEKIVEPHQAANNVGYLCMLQGNLEVAKQYFQLAIRKSPTYYQIAHDNLRHAKAP